MKHEVECNLNAAFERSNGRSLRAGQSEREFSASLNFNSPRGIEA